VKKTITKTTRTITTIHVVNGKRVEESTSTTTVEESGDHFDDEVFQPLETWLETILSRHFGRKVKVERS